MADVYGDAAGFPDAREPQAPIDDGRLAGVFCQLYRQKFTGLARVESPGRAALIGFRAGRPVSIEDSTPGTALGDQLVERGAITRGQYAAIIARVTEGLVENEDLAFCEHAVALGFLSQQDADEELSERTRTRLLQALSWRDCEITFDDSEDALSGHGEYPQEPGALVYMGVRTFYDDALLRGYVPDPTRHYPRLMARTASISEFFALDEDELKLLRALDPQSPIATLVGASIVDPGHAIALLALLAIAQLCEFSSTPFAPAEADRSGTRPAPAARLERGSSYRATPAVQAARPASQATMQAVRGARAPSQAVLHAATSEERPYERIAAPAVPGASAMSQTKLPAATALDAPIAERAASSGVVDATQEALKEAAARASRRRPLTPSAQRVMREPEVVRVGAAQAKPQAPAARPPDPAVRGEYAKAHLNELRQRHRQAQQPAAGATKREPLRTLRQAQEQLRDHHYARAEEIMRELVEQDPASELFRTYYLWSKFRALPDSGEAQSGDLLELAKKLMQTPEHVGFACYVLGHLYLAAKKDDLAEKYFRRAHAAEKGNKDAERHLLILERRKQLAAEAESAGNRKIFGISIAGKPKP
jgi:tetratricopeptide (TPR) repeat protein